MKKAVIVLALPLFLFAIGCQKAPVQSSSIASQQISPSSAASLSSTSSISSLASSNVFSAAAVSSKPANSISSVAPPKPSVPLSSTPKQPITPEEQEPVYSVPSVNPEEVTYPPLPMQNYSEKSIRIALLGNSFINSSSIGSILQQMAAESGVDLMVHAEAIGFAEVSTYLPRFSKEAYKDGSRYDLIFLCGLYSPTSLFDAEVSILLFQNAKTKLVFLPAYNENGFYVEEVYNMRQKSGVVHWRSALLEAMMQGFSELNLTFDDGIKHTNMVGGYLGASMIYTYLYQQKPNCPHLKQTFYHDFEGHLSGISSEEMPQALDRLEQIGYHEIMQSK